MPITLGKNLCLVAESARLFVVFALWRLTWSKRFGDVMIEGLDAPDESLRMIAGTLLMRSGAKVVPVIVEKLDKLKNLPMMLTMIGDLGGRDQIPLLERYSTHHRPDAAKAALDAIRIIHARTGEMP